MASPAFDARSIKHQAIANALFGVRLVTRSGDVTDSDLYPAAENVTAPDRVTDLRLRIRHDDCVP